MVNSQDDVVMHINLTIILISTKAYSVTLYNK